GSIPRVPAPEIEARVLDGVRKHRAATTEQPTTIADRDLVERYVERVIIRPQAVEVRLASSESSESGHAHEDSVQSATPSIGDPGSTPSPIAPHTPPGTPPSDGTATGIVHSPVTGTPIRRE